MSYKHIALKIRQIATDCATSSSAFNAIMDEFDEYWSFESLEYGIRKVGFKHINSTTWSTTDNNHHWLSFNSPVLWATVCVCVMKRFIKCTSISDTYLHVTYGNFSVLFVNNKIFTPYRICIRRVDFSVNNKFGTVFACSPAMFRQWSKRQPIEIHKSATTAAADLHAKFFVGVILLLLLY